MRRPYDRQRIPVVLIHGLWGNKRQWERMVRELEADAVLRDRYQFWTFGYATGEPVPFSALQLRQALRRARQEFDPGTADEAFDQTVLVGHSLGGLVAKMTAQTTGLRLWKTVSPQQPEKMSGPPEDCQLFRQAFIYERLSEVRRLIFIATPHRGSPLALGPLGDLGTRICRMTDRSGNVSERLLGRNDRTFFEPRFASSPLTSIGQLEPGSSLLAALMELGIDTAVRFHSIIPVQQLEDGSGTSDGIVPLESARLEGSVSELLVRAGHACLEEPAVIREIARILAGHLAEVRTGFLVPPGTSGGPRIN